MGIANETNESIKFTSSFLLILFSGYIENTDYELNYVDLTLDAGTICALYYRGTIAVTKLNTKTFSNKGL